MGLGVSKDAAGVLVPGIQYPHDTHLPTARVDSGV